MDRSIRAVQGQNMDHFHTRRQFVQGVGVASVVLLAGCGRDVIAIV